MLSNFLSVVNFVANFDVVRLTKLLVYKGQ